MTKPFIIAGAPAELMATINARRARFAPDMMMMVDPAPAAGDQPGTPPAAEPKAPSADEFKSEESKRAVLADLAAEREARKELQREIAAMKGSVGVLDALRQVLAPADGKPDPNADLAAQVAELRRERDTAKADKERTTKAATLAAEIGVTDIADVALIAAQATEDAMRALAARLKGGTPGPSTPKHDPSAGHSGDPKPRTLSEAINHHYST